MKKISKLLCFMLVFITVMAGFCSVSFAASVGQQLTNPESGWKRYDNTESLLQYTGVWKSFTDSSIYQGELVASTTSDSKLKFQFYGTSIRIIDQKGANRSGDIKVQIDNDIESYSCYNSTTKSQILVYEKKDLQLGIHTVSLYTTQAVFGIDAIDIDQNGFLVDINVPTNLMATGGNGKIDLSWDAVEGAASYIVKRSETPGGPYQTITTTSAITYTDRDVTNGTTYYYVVTAVVNGVESDNSNEASATPTAPVVTGNSAILEITMVTGEMKEYDLTAAELRSFLSWYDGRSNGADKAYYMIPKKNNIKPFLSRKDYIAFDKISSFEVKEYTD